MKAVRHFRIGEKVVHSTSRQRGVVLDCWPVEIHLKPEQRLAGNLRNGETRIYEVDGGDGKIFVAYEEQLAPGE